MIEGRLAVIGLGLIGGSLARALRGTAMAREIQAFDPDPARAAAALALGVVDRVCESAAEAVRNAAVVVLAVPVLRTADALAAIRPALAERAVLTDVGSTKQSVLADVAAGFGRLLPRFVAGHPIAGTEKSGVEASQVDLFRGKRVVLTPHAGQDPQALAQVHRLWGLTGARVVEMDAARHDAIFAATSHLPHVLAYAFVAMLTELDREQDIFSNAGGGFRDFTRIASSSPRMWHDIVRANRDEVSRLLARQIGVLEAVQSEIREGRWGALEQRFESARQARERYLGSIE